MKMISCLARPARPGLLAAGGLICSVAALAQGVQEQQIAGTPTLTFGLDSRLVANDNLGLDADSAGTSTFWENSFALGLDSQTQLSRLRLDFAGVARAADTPGFSGTSGFDEPEIGLAYSREGTNARIEADTRFSQRDLAFLNALRGGDDITDNTFIQQGGTREIREGSFLLETGLTAPLGFSFGIDHREEDFSGTQDPDFFDSDRTQLTASARARLSPRTEGVLSLSQTDYSASDTQQTDRETHEISFAVTHEVSRIMLLEASIGATDVDESFDTPGIPDDDQNGLTGSFALTRELPTGSVGASIDSRVENTGQRTELAVQRTLLMPRAELSVSAGVSDTENGGIDPNADISYIQQLPTGELSLTFSQSVVTSDDSDDLRRSRAALVYRHEINSLSRVFLNFDYIDVAEAGSGNAQDEKRATLSVTYSRDIAADWDLNIGYTYDYEKTSGIPSADSNEISLGISRTFSIRP